MKKSLRTFFRQVTRSRKSSRRRPGRLKLEALEPIVLLHGGGEESPPLEEPPASIDPADFDQSFSGSQRNDRFRAGSGSQFINAGARNDHIMSFGDAGEPDPAQTDGSEGRVNPPVPDGTANDVYFGGAGADTFQFIPLINAKEEVLDQYRNHTTGQVNWQRVAGENDNVHDHWVEGIGDDTVLDFNKEQGDRILITGHTVAKAYMEYGEDDLGSFTLIVLKSNQGGAGAHDGDPLGSIKVYGDPVWYHELEIDAGVFYGMERLDEANRLAADNGGGSREIISATDGDVYDANSRVRDFVTIGRGSQDIDAGPGNDKLIIYGDAGEPDPAQTDNGEGRVNDPVDPDLADDVILGGLGKDEFLFRPLINAKEDIIAKHTRDNGTVNWRRVAGENDNVHDHWVEGVGEDTILGYDEAEGDRIRIHGHTVAIAAIEHGEDDQGSFSLIVLVSDQGGAGAHDGDSLGSIRVYGDEVTEDDIDLNAGVFYGIDRLDAVDAHDNSEARDSGLFGSPSDAFQPYVPDYTAENEFEGTRLRDKFRVGAGQQFVDGEAGNDHFYSFGDAGEPDPAQTEGSAGRVNDPVPDGLADDVFRGGAGADTFEFVPLLNAREQVLDQYRNHNSGRVNWARVAGENDNVHDHWVEGVGNDTILDYNEAEGDRIKITGHTVALVGIEYGQDDGGAFSLIVIKSDQGGAGAHDGDPLGTIKVYGDEVTADDLEITAGVTYGMERLQEADRLAPNNGGGSRAIISGTDGDSFTGGGRVVDRVTIGRGSQEIDAGAGNDFFLVYGDAGEPDPAQTEGAEGRVNDPIDPSLADDVVRGGQGRDKFVFRPLINAKEEIIAKHTRDNGTVNWRRVAGENDNVHDHWVEGVGNDTVLDFDKDDGDQIRIEGHTAAIERIEYGEDDGGRFSLIVIVSDQGGAGAHDGDSLGSIKVYGDKVNQDDVVVKAGVFYGVDRLDAVDELDNSETRLGGEIEDDPAVPDEGDDAEPDGDIEPEEPATGDDAGDELAGLLTDLAERDREYAASVDLLVTGY